MAMTEADRYQAWLEWRRGGVGASDLAAADTGRYGGAYAKVADKLGYASEQIAAEDADRGHRWEQPIADGVHALTGLYVHGEQMWMAHRQHPRHRATIDGLLDERPVVPDVDEFRAVLESKTSRQHVIPPWDYYRAQVQWQMHVVGVQRALIVVAVIGVTPDGDETVVKLHLEWVERDDDHIARLVDLAEWLLDCVDNDRLPEPDEHTRVADVRAVNRDADETATVDIDDLEVAVESLRDTKAHIAWLKKDAEHYEAKIRHRMGEATEATTSDGRWRVRVGEPVQRFTDDSEAAALLLHPEYAKTVLDRQRFKDEHPGHYDELKTATTDRRLTVKETGSSQ